MTATPRLLERREVYDGFVDMVDLVIELEHPREGDVASRRTRFDEQRRAIEARITALDGEVVGGAWINSTLLVRVPANVVDALSEIDGVERVDVPHKIRRD